MNQLTILNKNGGLVVDSREVSKMLKKRHDHLMRDIKGYIQVLETNPKLGR